MLILSTQDCNIYRGDIMFDPHTCVCFYFPPRELEGNLIFDCAQKGCEYQLYLDHVEGKKPVLGSRPYTMHTCTWVTGGKPFRFLDDDRNFQQCKTYETWAEAQACTWEARLLSQAQHCQQMHWPALSRIDTSIRNENDMCRLIEDLGKGELIRLRKKYNHIKEKCTLRIDSIITQQNSWMFPCKNLDEKVLKKYYVPESAVFRVLDD